jgi:hypothetical protein
MFVKFHVDVNEVPRGCLSSSTWMLMKFHVDIAEVPHGRYHFNNMKKKSVLVQPKLENSKVPLDFVKMDQTSFKQDQTP